MFYKQKDIDEKYTSVLNIINRFNETEDVYLQHELLNEFLLENSTSMIKDYHIIYILNKFVPTTLIFESKRPNVHKYFNDNIFHITFRFDESLISESIVKKMRTDDIKKIGYIYPYEYNWSPSITGEQRCSIRFSSYAFMRIYYGEHVAE